MGTLTLRLPNEQHERLKTLAARRGVSLKESLIQSEIPCGTGKCRQNQ